MAKFYGTVGYAEMQETRPGIHKEVVTERNYAGDVFRNTRKLEAGESINDNVVVNNRISMLPDGFTMPADPTFKVDQHTGVISVSGDNGASWTEMDTKVNDRTFVNSRATENPSADPEWN